MEISKTKVYILGGIGVVVIVAGFVLASYSGVGFDIKNNGQEPKAIAQAKSSLAGLNCEQSNARPFALMISSDKEARPLSGISEADWVFEMPVVENGFTRMMAVYQCGRPKEVGSIRSARQDFVPLALGLDVIYAHFGGEHDVLERLNAGVINNVDGLRYDGTIYYRKTNIPRPHNAFTNFELLTKISKELGYDTQRARVNYLHEKESKSQGETQPPALFKDEFAVTWRYDKTTNSYFRSRGGRPEIDKNNNKQVEAKNVVILRTTWSPVSKDYIRVKTVGSGGLLLYKNGTVVTGTWEKRDDTSKLMFFDQNHKEIELAEGITWVEVTTSN